MKKIVISIILAVVLIALTTVGIFVYRYRSFVKILTLDTEETKQQTVSSGDSLRLELEEELGFAIPEFTDEEKERIANGEISASQLLTERIEQYIAEHPELFADADAAQNASEENDGQGDADQQDQQGDQNSSGQGATAQEETTQAIVVRYTREFAALRSQYTGALDALIGAAKAEMQPGKRTETVARYSGEARALESSCDAEVEALLSKMSAELSRAGGDTSIVNTIRQSYASEKAAREVYYRDKLSSML